MSLQYLSDATGKPTAVVIPIREWENMTARHPDLKQLEESGKKPSSFRGTISQETADELQEYVKQSRSEWERNT